MIVIKSERLRKLLRLIIPFIAIPAVIIIGIAVFDEKRYAFISLAVAILALVLFAAGFERKQTGTRRMIVAAVMTALSVAGRFIPVFKPITAITVISGMYLGGETGFLVGALSAVISNFYFGQGPWTPFQMFAWGMIGLISGALCRPLKKKRAVLIVWGAVCGILYSFIMDIWTVLWYSGSFDASLYLSALATALPYTLIYAASNVVFLWLLAKPFGEKLERVKLKYGI